MPDYDKNDCACPRTHESTCSCIITGLTQYKPQFAPFSRDAPILWGVFFKVPGEKDKCGAYSDRLAAAEDLADKTNLRTGTTRYSVRRYDRPEREPWVQAYHDKCKEQREVRV